MKNKKKILVGLLLALGTLLVSFGLKSSGLLGTQNQNLSTKLYNTRSINEDILIVAMDEKTLSSKEQGGLGGSASRKNYADVLDQIEKGQPAAVFYDVLFSSASSGIRGDELFGFAGENPTLSVFATEVLSYLQTPHPYDQYFADVLSKYENVYLMKNYIGAAEWSGKSFDITKEERAIDILFENSNAGFASVIDNEDGENSSMIFAIPTIFNLNDAEEEHVDLQLARKYLGTSDAFNIPTEQGQMIINYAQPSYSFPMVSFSDVYFGRVDPAVFEGKIILIGATASILQDRHFTPIDQTKPMPGIEIHANAIQTILDGEYLHYQSMGGFLMEVGILLLISVFVFLYVPVLVGSGFLVLELAAFPFYAQFMFNRGTIIDLIWPVFAMATAYLAALVYRNLTEFAEKRKLKTAFARYVSKDLVEEITEKPELLKLGGERRNITALFLDIENFTNLSESLAPQEVVGIINTYFDALCQVIMAHEGSVDKFEGDAIMALFGAPLPTADHAVKACHAALAIREKMDELNAATGRNLNIRIGIASGDAIVGNMGSAERFDYTAMGDIVNTASRLEGANKFYKTRILVNPGTHEVAKSEIFFRQVDTVCLKGKDNAIEIYEVMGTNAGASADGKKLVEDWHSALETYHKGDFAVAESGMKSILEKLPDDGPATTLLARMAELKMLPEEEVRLRRVVWSFDQK